MFREVKLFDRFFSNWQRRWHSKTSFAVRGVIRSELRILVHIASSAYWSKIPPAFYWIDHKPKSLSLYSEVGPFFPLSAVQLRKGNNVKFKQHPATHRFPLCFVLQSLRDQSSWAQSQANSFSSTCLWYSQRAKEWERKGRCIYAAIDGLIRALFLEGSLIFTRQNSPS